MIVHWLYTAIDRPIELQPTSRSEQEFKSKEIPQLTVAEKMQRIGIIINISLERSNRHTSPTKASGSPLGVIEASPRRIGQHTWDRGRSRAIPIPHII